MGSHSQERIKNVLADAVAVVGSTQYSRAIRIRHLMSLEKLLARIRFTKGSLTNASFKVQVSPDKSPDAATWFDVAASDSGVLTASANLAISCAVPGARMARVAYTATGTTTSSSVGIDFSWQEQ